jgi:hypothetical protein
MSLKYPIASEAFRCGRVHAQRHLLVSLMSHLSMISPECKKALVKQICPSGPAGLLISSGPIACAPLLLFRSTSAQQEACVASAKELATMDVHLAEATIKSYLTEIRNRLDKAAGIGRAADACAGAGFHEKGLEVALDIEQLLY